VAATRVIRRLRDLQDVHTTIDPGMGASPVDDGSGTYPLTLVTTQQDLDGILASVAAVNWRPLQLEPGFEPYGEGFADPKYRVTLNNVVHVEGMVRCVPPLSEDDNGKVITRLAADALPDGKLLFGCPAWQNTARFDVEPTGEIIFFGMLLGGGMIDWTSLMPINFSVGAATP
jgi:hypothetical protein